MLTEKDSKLAVLMTCFNRRDITLRSLRALMSQVGEQEVEVYLVDDGSPDGTGEAVKALYPAVHVIEGTGSLFWAGGMRVAFENALRKGHPGYLWLNDDVELDLDAIERLLKVRDELKAPAIIGGAMREPITGEVTYSGGIRRGTHPLHYGTVRPGPGPQEVDILNGNFFYVPGLIAQKIGGIADYLVHGAGDLEYCFRAKKNGFSSYLMPGTFGICATNPPVVKVRGIAGVRKALGAKQLPLSMGYSLYRQMAGSGWWFWLSSYYVRSFLKGT